MARKWNPERPTNRDDVIATLQDAGLDPNALIEAFLFDDAFDHDGDPRLKHVFEPKQQDNRSNHLFYIRVPKDEAIEHRDHIKPIAAKHGLFPIIHADIVNGTYGCPNFAQDPGAILAASKTLEATDRAAEWWDCHVLSKGKEWRVRRESIEQLELDPAFIPAEQPTEIPIRTTPYLDAKFAPWDSLHTAIVFLPGVDWCDALSRINYGGNQPMTALMIAYLRQWGQRYGIDIINLNGDSIELRVKRPPQTREDAIRLARECFLLCPDLYGQMDYFHGFPINTLYDLAAHLMGSTYWILWWD